jgi:ammonia channel protein AmtB
MFVTWALRKARHLLENGVLAGLVGVTTGCAAVKPSWSSFYWTNMRYRGCICNEFIDKKT